MVYVAEWDTLLTSVHFSLVEHFCIQPSVVPGRTDSRSLCLKAQIAKNFLLLQN